MSELTDVKIIEQLGRERDSLQDELASLRTQLEEALTPHPFDIQPKPHQEYTQHWLSANEKKPNEVHWSLYPIGMVGRWIERAETAEANNRKLREALEYAAKKYIFMAHPITVKFVAKERAVKLADEWLDECAALSQTKPVVTTKEPNKDEQTPTTTS